MSDKVEASTGEGHGNLATRILTGLLIGAAAGSFLNYKFAPAAGAAPGAGIRTHPLVRGQRRDAGRPSLPADALHGGRPPRLLLPVPRVSGLGDLRKLGKIGARTLAWFGMTTGLAVVLGLVLMNTFEPGKKIDRAKAEEIRKEFKGEADKKVEAAKEGTGFGIQTFVNIVPKNVVRSAADDRDTLGLIFFALILGAAATSFAPEKLKPFVDVCQILYDPCVKVLGYAMKLAP
jgi:L-cystine uptake protein TcyP (sodium:dicarboxylate symporter family)